MGTLAEDLQGRILDLKYQLIRQIGEGGMGTVWEAEHMTIRRRVAVKIMHKGENESPRSLKRFIREAQAAGGIGHPNIVEIYDVGVEDDGIAYMVMELLKGVSLADLLWECGTLPPGRVVMIILQVLSALHAAHQKGIIHRDLKPDNVFLAVDARAKEDVKLLDFGIAKILTAEAESVKLTKPGAILGTPQYLSPEQAAGSQDVDARVDIWAVGVMMYEMLAGRQPYTGKNYNEVIRNILMSQPFSLRDLAPKVPEELSDIVSKTLQKDRAQRYQNIADLMYDLMPLNDRFDQEMGTDAARKARESVLEVATEDRQKAEDRQESPISTVGSYDTTMTLSGFSPDITGKPTSSWIRSTLAVAVVALLSLLVVLMIVIPSEGDALQKNFSNTVGQSSIGSELEQNNPGLSNPNAISKAAVAVAPIAQKEEAPGTSTVKPPTASETTVTVEIVNLPPRAKVFWGGRRVSHPIQITRSTTQTTLRVTCPGYRPHVQRVTPSKDSRLEIDMKKRLLRGGTKSGGRSFPLGERWKDNPFGLKEKRKVLFK